MTPANQLERAYALQRGGDLPSAVNAYRSLLLSEPKNFDALFLCALAEAQLGHGGEAIQCLERALAIRPSSADALNAYGHALMEAGRTEDAMAPCKARVSPLWAMGEYFGDRLNGGARRAGHSPAMAATETWLGARRETGKRMVTVVPMPTSLCRSRIPPWSSTRLLASGSPRPVPSYLRLNTPSTYSNWAKALGISAEAMPMPLSAIWIT